MSDITKITTPVGRIVGGDVYKAFENKDNKGVTKLNTKGEPSTSYYIGLAVTKTPNVPWESEPWGVAIMSVAKAAFPAHFDPASGQLYAGRTFAFKVTDGDSTIPNKKGNKPCDQEGYPGNWIINFSNGFAPSCFNANGTAPLTEQMIKRGYYVQISSTVKGNGSDDSPGVYLNHDMLAFSAYGEEIIGGAADPTAAGFGQSPLPAGASATPIGQMATEQAPAAPTAPVAPATDLAPPPPPVEEKYAYNGKEYTKAQLLAFPGWTEAHLVNIPKV